MVAGLPQPYHRKSQVNRAHARARIGQDPFHLCILTDSILSTDSYGIL
jgi:hypothetical protein